MRHYNRLGRQGLSYGWLLILWGCLLAGCQGSKRTTQAQGALLAEVHGVHLYAQELPADVASDSAQRSVWVDNWVNEELLANAALADEGLALDALEQQVVVYRKALLRDALRRATLKKHLDTTLSARALLVAYEKTREKHFLATDIFRFAYLRIPRAEVSTSRFRRAWRQKPVGLNKQQVVDFCSQATAVCRLDTGTWVGRQAMLDLLPEVLRNAALARLKRTYFFEGQAKNHLYFIHVVDKQERGSLPPLSYLEAKLRQNIYIERKQVVLRNLYKQLREDAEKGKHYKIYF